MIFDTENVEFLIVGGGRCDASLLGGVGGVPPGGRQGAAPRGAAPGEHDQSVAHILLHTLAHDLVLPLEVVDAVLLVRELAAALGAHKGVVLPALVLQVPVQVIIPVVGALKI